MVKVTFFLNEETVFEVICGRFHFLLQIGLLFLKCFTM